MQNTQIISPHCIVAARSRTRVVAPAGGDDDRQQEECVHGDERREQAVPAQVDPRVLRRQHDEEADCEGAVVAAARVYVSDMNSRSAAQETNRNRSVIPARPARNAMPITSTITHHVLIRALRLSMTPWGAPCASPRFSASATSDAATRKTPTPPKSATSCSCADSMLMAGRRRGSA